MSKFCAPMQKPRVTKKRLFLPVNPHLQQVAFTASAQAALLA